MFRMGQRTITIRDVVITGFGAVTSLGHAVGIETPDKTLPSMAEALLEARNGFSEATLFATEEIPVKKAAEVSDLEGALDRKALKQLGRGQQLGVLAAEYAMIDAGGVQGHYDPYRFGAWVGTDFGAISLKQWGTIWESVSDQDRHLVNQKFTPTIANRWTPTWVLKSMTNGCQSHIAIRHQMLGEGSTNSQACAASTLAIGSALRSIQYGQNDACIAGGTSATVIDFFVAGFLPLTTMSESGNHRPYDKARDGFILGEGAAFLILEEEVMARQRGARCYARLRGFATRGDGFNITAPSAAGSAATIKAALEDAEVDPDEVGYINGHGSATQIGDKVEADAFHAVFGNQLESIPVSSSKGAFGHLLTAAGAVELAATLCTIVKDGSLPPTVGLEQPDKSLGMHPVHPDVKEKLKKPVFIKHNTGFGGQNGTLVVEML